MNSIRSGNPLRSDGDGEQTRDMVYIDDVVRANVLAAGLQKATKGEICNIGSGKSYSNNEILAMIKSKILNLSIVNAPEREGDVKHTRADIKKSEEFLGFKTDKSFEEGLEITMNWWEIV